MENKWEQTADNAWTAILDHVKKLKNDGLTLHEIAIRVGVKNRSVISEWLNGNRAAAKTSFSNIMFYLENLNIDYHELFPQAQMTPSMRRIGSHSPVEAVVGDGLPTIPVFLEAGAGTPAEFFSAAPERFIEVLPQYALPELRAVRVTGDSMEPTIKKGAFVGVIPLPGELEEGGIYLVSRPPFGLVVKRVMQDADGHIVLHSDNPKWPPQVVNPDGYEDIIVGKVMWIWQMA